MDEIARYEKLFVADILQDIIVSTVRRMEANNDMTMEKMVNLRTETLDTIRKEMAGNELVNRFDTFKVNNDLFENPPCTSYKGSDFRPLIEDLDGAVRAILRQMVVRLVMDTVRMFEPRTRLHHGSTAAVNKVVHPPMPSNVTDPSNEDILKIVQDPGGGFEEASHMKGLDISGDVPIDNVVRAHDRKLGNDKKLKIDYTCTSDDFLRNNEELRPGNECNLLENYTFYYMSKKAHHISHVGRADDDYIADDDYRADDNYRADERYRAGDEYREEKDSTADEDYRADNDNRADDKVNGKHTKKQFNTRLVKAFRGLSCCFSKSSKYR